MTTDVRTKVPSLAAPSGKTHPLAGTGAMIRFILRRDRVRLPVWIVAITGSLLGSVATFPETYPTLADRQARAEVLDNPAAVILTGPGYGLDDYTFGAMTANEMLPMMAVVVALMSIFLVIRHTRAEEETGRAELVRATVVGRHASTAATLTVVAGAHLLLAALLALGLPATVDELSTTGSLALAASLAAVGLVFAGVAVVAAQLTEHARGAIGIASAALGLGYVLRTIGYLTDETLTWLSPFGWAESTRSYVDERWWPLLLALATTILLVAAAVILSVRRDVGAGMVAARPGPAGASRMLASPFGLALRLQRATLAAWTLGLFLLGLLFGAIAEEAGEFYEEIEAIQDYLERIGVADPADQYLAVVLFTTVLVAAAYGVQSALRLRSEETAIRAEPLLATAVDRWRWMASHLTMALGGTVVLLLAAGFGAGVTRAISTEDVTELPRLIGAALAYAPALWIFIGVAAVLFGLAARAASLVWVAVGAVVFIGWLGPLLQLPDWIYDISPVEHTPRLPAAEFSVGPLIVLTAIAAGLIAIGLLGFRRRDVGRT